jgi:hypothetical protein
LQGVVFVENQGRANFQHIAAQALDSNQHPQITHSVGNIRRNRDIRRCSHRVIDGACRVSARWFLFNQVIEEYWPEFQAELAQHGKNLPAYITTTIADGAQIPVHRA